MKRSKFSLSHYKLLTCKMGQLVPVAWFEALPGDTVEQATSALVRCAPLVTPVMHPVNVRFHHWFVPNRLTWANWQNFITGGANGLDASAAPYVSSSNAAVSSLLDYMGVPTAGLGGATKFNALPFRAYDLIWNEFYRDEDLQTALTVATTDGLDNTSNVTLQNISWEKDYLTSSRPWVIKGATVNLPLGGNAPVKGIGAAGTPGTATSVAVKETTPLPNRTYGFAATGFVGASNAMTVEVDSASSATTKPLVFADLSNATGIDINTVRHAFALQRFEEARARYGSRYTEYLRYLGVRSSDARLQRPEYLGGGRQVIQFSEVLQTGGTSTGAQTGVGTMAGHGISAMRTNRYRRFFEEHGIVITLMSVRPKTMYTQRVKRSFIRGIDNTLSGTTGTKEDYWQKELQHIGQQGINGLEADAQVGNVNFGYQDRYDEYRREESSVAGLFRSTLNTWHLSRDFGSAPALNSTFVSCVPSTRVFADTSNDNLYVMANHKIRARRLLSREGNSMTF
ncbi:major capsid protein [Blackfly microvirus SF02]|uniref:Major capsid protein n=1 Tax=Blackfly microvirus SF02 TaxID=2576452 RepID=A0A4P8PKU6_9VIRU|nr:major capsid protein [Blackfly microvirus SF02]